VEGIVKDGTSASAPLYLRDIRAVFVMDKHGRVLQLTEHAGVTINSPVFRPLVNPVEAIAAMLRRIATIRKMEGPADEN
jgi:hypothetical protein